MNKITLSLFTISLICLMISCKSLVSEYGKTEHGISVNTDVGVVVFEVFDEHIIRCIANPSKIDDSYSSKIVETTPVDVSWEIIEEGNKVGVSTAKIKALVDKTTGAIIYYDSNNKILLAEPKSEGRVFGENIINENKAQYAKQTFLSDADEAIYGLGQNHTDKLNLKGSNLELFQRNTEIYIPLLVSSKNYGILWDNYAHNKFGNLQEAQFLPTTAFTDTAGNTGKLSSEFYSDSNFKEAVEWNDWDGTMDFNKNMDKSSGINSIRLSGSITLDESGEYELIKEERGKLMLYIDGERVMEFWQSILSTPRPVHINLEKGKHKVVIEYTQIKDEFPTLKWRKPSEKNENISIWSASARNIDYYFIYGEKNLDDVVSGFRQLTGQASLLPKWAYGFWQSRNRYKTQDEILEMTQKLRSNDIPFDNIVQDWHYWENDKWGSHTFNKETFPDPSKMMKDIHDMNANVMISVWGKFYPETENYKELDAAGAMFSKYADEKQLDFRKHLNSYYDPYNAEGRKIYWDQINTELYTHGIDAWWLDGTEPAFDKDFSADKRAYYMEPNAFGSGHDYLNLYALFNSKAIYDGQRSVDPNKRIFILTRSSFAGMQKYAASAWSGDVAASWDTFRQEIVAGLNYSLSGMPYWTDDIGGYISEMRDDTFFYDEFEELFTRWFQFGTFSPIFRAHGDEHPQNMLAFKKEYFDAQLKFDKLRYSLMPYIYSVAGAVTHDDYTMMRGLVFDFANDKKVYDINDQFMFGPSLLICPVTAYKAREREVYLPISEGGWYDFWRGKHYEGGKSYTVSAPLDEMPIFVKAGSIIPFGPELQYTTEKKPNPILLKIYGGSNAEFTLYEDEGVNYNYENEKFSNIRATWNDEMNQLNISDRKGAFEGMLENRKFDIQIISTDKPVGYNQENNPSKNLDYSGSSLRVNFDK